jgi:hypothetical protein
LRRARRLEQHVGEGREPKAKLIRPQGGGRGAVGEQIELLPVQWIASPGGSAQVSVTTRRTVWSPQGALPGL